MSKSDAYLEFLEARAVPEYESVEGCIDARILRREEGDVVHFQTLTFWESKDAIREFTGTNIARAKYYPEDDDFLLEFELTVEHYEVYPSKG